jgi:protein TonB
VATASRGREERAALAREGAALRAIAATPAPMLPAADPRPRVDAPPATTVAAAVTLAPAPTPVPAPVVAPPTETPLVVFPRTVALGTLVGLDEPGLAPPTPAEAPPPPYSVVAARLGLQGRVELRVLVDERGAILDTEIVSGPSTLAVAAARHIQRRWRYRPATVNGVAVRVWIPVSVRYEMR